MNGRGPAQRPESDGKSGLHQAAAGCEHSREQRLVRAHRKGGEDEERDEAHGAEVGSRLIERNQHPRREGPTGGGEKDEAVIPRAQRSSDHAATYDDASLHHAAGALDVGHVTI